MLSAVQTCDGKDVVQQLAAYVVAARKKPSSQADCNMAKKCVIDAVIAAATGIKERGPSAIRDVLPVLYASGTVPVWFSNVQSSALGATYANSSAIAVIDLDDGNAYARGHPGAAVVSTAFAVGHEANATLDDILTAIVIGYEVGVVVGTARKTYGNTGTWSTYAVVATIAALRDTTQQQIEHALAIAGESAPNQLFMSARSKTPVPEGSDVKEGIPWSVVTGFDALYRAEAGHTGSRNILDSTIHYGYPATLNLGSGRIRETYFKPYAACRHVHAPIAATLTLIERHKIDVSDILSINVETNHWAHTLPNKPRPENLSDVQYSIPYCLALVALTGKKALVPLTAEALGRDDVVALAEKITVTIADDMPKERASMETPARVTIISNGGSFVYEQSEPEGGVTNQPSLEDLDRKFITATRFVAGGEKQGQILSGFKALVAGDMDEFVAGLAVKLVGEF